MTITASTVTASTVGEITGGVDTHHAAVVDHVDRHLAHPDVPDLLQDLRDDDLSGQIATR